MEQELVDAGVCRKRLTLTFSSGEVAAVFDESYAELDGYVQVKGFRKGRAPRRLLEKKYAREAAQGAEERLAGKNIARAIEEMKLKVLGSVAGLPGAAGIAPGRPFKVAVEFDVMPEFDLPAYKGLELAAQPVEIDEDRVDQALERFRLIFAKHEKFDGPARAMDIVNVDFRAEVDDREIMSMADKNLRVDGDRLFGMPYPELVEKFTGVKAGDGVAIEITLPDDHPDADLRGRKAAVAMKVNYVERPEYPPLDDAFAANLGLGSLQNLRSRVQANLVRESMIAARNRREEEVIDKLVAAASFAIPERTRENEVAAILDRNRQELLKRGARPEEVESELRAMREDAEKLAERRVRWEIIASAIAEKEGITVTTEELSSHIEALAASYKTTPAKLLKRIREFDGVGQMLRASRDLKVMQMLLDSARDGGKDGHPGAIADRTAEADAAAAWSAPDPCAQNPL